MSGIRVMDKQTCGLHMQLRVPQNAAANAVFYRLVGFVTGMASALDNDAHYICLKCCNLLSIWLFAMPNQYYMISLYRGG